MKPPTRSMCSSRATLLVLAAAAASLTTQVAADSFGSGANQFDIDFVPIGNAGNAADTTQYRSSVGAVPYTYQMGTYEVSRDTIDKANSAGGLVITMFDMTGRGGNGANRPATGVSWYEAAQLVNWLNTSTGHAPAYNFVAGNFTLWSAGDAWQNGGQNLYRNKDAYYFLPSENEWYKAAYYNGNAGVYYDYPTGSDTTPAAVAGGTGAGTAVYNQPFLQGPADIAKAGGVSPYGTMGQGGNVWEWLETADDELNNSTSEARGLRGGYWGHAAVSLESSMLAGLGPSSEGYSFVGFRVASITVPEPTESAVVIGSLALGFALWRRRGSL